MAGKRKFRQKRELLIGWEKQECVLEVPPVAHVSTGVNRTPSAVGARPQRNETGLGGRIWGKEVNTFFVFSLREKVAAGRMKGFLQISNSNNFFIICNNPSPTADAVPPLPKRARVFQSSADSTIYPWARVLSH